MVENVEYRQLVVGSINSQLSGYPAARQGRSGPNERRRGGGSQAGQGGGNTARKQKHQWEPELFREGGKVHAETSENMYLIST